ncbi:MAG TPA: hypothetical protein VFM01_17350, partial [Nakamurella sp.]|nr:hypothetical protein [Nakamurella sp.]
ISVKCIFEVEDARDIRPLSEVAVEEEWVLLPGTTFSITKIEDDSVKDVGRPPAAAWKVVHLKQIKRPANPPARAAVASPAKAGAAAGLSSPAAAALAKLSNRDFSAPAAGASPAEGMRRLGRRDFRVR